jgi:hypothetical protein
MHGRAATPARAWARALPLLPVAFGVGTAVAAWALGRQVWPYLPAGCPLPSIPWLAAGYARLLNEPERMDVPLRLPPNLGCTAAHHLGQIVSTDGQGATQETTQYTETPNHWVIPNAIQFLGESVNFLGEFVNFLGEFVNFLGEFVNFLGEFVNARFK